MVRGFSYGSWVYAMVRGFTQWFVGLRNGSWVYAMVCGFAQWFVDIRNGSWAFAMAYNDVCVYVMVRGFRKICGFGSWV